MARSVDPARRCLLVCEWPTLDQERWNGALCARELEDETLSSAALWRPATLQTNREGYGRWINHLMRSGCNLNGLPEERVTPERVRAYLAELNAQHIGVRTRCNRISQLLNVILAIAPDRDWSWLRRRFNRLDALAREAHESVSPEILAGDILDRSFKALRALEDKAYLNFAAAITYRNWLMLATMTLIPLRRKNFAALSMSEHLRQAGHEWLLEVSAPDAKGKKTITMPIPPVLYAHLRHYIDVVRPKLLKGRENDRLWITNRHTALTSHSLYVAITNFMRGQFGTALAPHRFRHTGATSVVIAAPEKIEAARALLGHGDHVTTREHYVVAQSLAASRQRAALVAKLRRTLPGAKRGSAESAPRPAGDKRASSVERKKSCRKGK